MSDSKTDPPGDPIVGILSELTTAIERNAELSLSIARLIAANDLEANKAVREAVIAASHATTAARAAEAAVNVFAESVGTLNANIELLRGELRRGLSRISGVELELEDRLTATPPSSSSPSPTTHKSGKKNGPQ